MTPRKLLNLLRCELDKFKRVPRPRSAPFVAVLDVTNHCNLKCPFCPTGSRRDSGRGTGFLDLSVAQRMADELGAYLVSVKLYNWGEPLLHPRIADFIRIFRKRRVFTVLSTNLCIANTRILEDICDAGLDYLSVSVSGASQAVYEQYHAGGDIQRVLSNLRHIQAYKRPAARSAPWSR